MGESASTAEEDLLLKNFFAEVTEVERENEVNRYEHLGNHFTELIVSSTDKQPVIRIPGEEVHYNQHGLLLLEGQGIYRLGDNWYPVQTGDAIWMAPFVPQWYAALGKTRSRYLLYKDGNRSPL